MPPDYLRGLLAVHAAATMFMTGVIWFVQVVHYPLFRQVGAERYPDYQKSHMARTSWVVLPAMALELFCAAVLCVAVSPSGRSAALVGLGLLGVIWLATLLAQVPAHQRLAGGYDADAHGKLLRGNWLRTAAGSVRAGISLWLWFVESGS